MSGIFGSDSAPAAETTTSAVRLAGASCARASSWRVVVPGGVLERGAEPEPVEHAGRSATRWM